MLGYLMRVLRLPIRLLRFCKRTVQSRPDDKFGWFGDYQSWDSACSDTSGYDSEVILAKVSSAQEKVLRGEAAFERDSVVFKEPQYNYSLLASLLLIASRSSNVLRVMDFGGSLGSTYLQNRTLFDHLSHLRWSIIEQDAFVEWGRRHFETEQLRFCLTIDEATAEYEFDVLLLSSVLPYLECPHAFLDDAVSRRFRFILVDRTGFVAEGGDRLTIQKVPPSIYEASYPCWFFSREKFLAHFARDYDVIMEFRTADKANIAAEFKGFLFQRRDGRA